MMRRIFERTFVLAILTVFVSFPAFGWDDVGHKITGYIAWQRMSPQAREAVIRILRAAPEESDISTFYMSYGPESEEIRKREFFMLIPTWADIIRDRAFPARYRTYHKSNWHYDDTFWKQVDGKIEILSGFEEGGEAALRMGEAEKTLRDSNSKESDKAVAIAWLMHLGGDIHQPLHTSARVTDREPKGDQGGNLFLLTPEGTKREDQLNLHWYWDSITGRNIPIKAGECGRAYVEKIARKMMSKHPFAMYQSELKLWKFEEWQKESFPYNNTFVFSADLKRFETPSPTYKRNAFKLAEKQLALAGYRLGEMLNEVFGKPAMNTSAIRLNFSNK
ncbi:MAG: S1/P1 nuclease [Blastocatellia bacterium]